MNENTPGVVLVVVLEVDGVVPKLKVLLPDVDELEEVEDVGLVKLKEGLLSILVSLLVVALLNGFELSDVEDGVVVVPNGEVVLPVAPNTGEALGFPNADVLPVPNAIPVVPKAGVVLLVFVPNAEVVPLEAPVPKAEPVVPNGEVAAVVAPPSPNPVMVVASFAAAVVVVPKVGPKEYGAPAFDVVVPVEDAPVVGLKLNIGVAVSFFSVETAAGVVAVVVVLAVGLLKLKEIFGTVLAPVMLADVWPVVSVMLALGEAVGNALTGAALAAVVVSDFANVNIEFDCACA